MTGLMRYNSKTPEGKYPIVLRRDGTAVKDECFVLLLKDPCAAAALRTYANKAAELNLDPAYVKSVRRLAGDASDENFDKTWETMAKKPDPDKGCSRTDDPVLLALARSLKK